MTSFTRDALGRTTSVTDPENRLVEFRYNGADQITNLITWVGSQQRRGLCLVLLVVDVGSLFANRPACFTTPDGGPKFTS